MLWAIYIVIFLGSFFGVYGLMRFAPKMQLLAMPGGHRKHSDPTPMVGGIGIYLGFVIGWALIGEPSWGLMACLTIMCFVGALDDRYALPSWQRFLVQGVSAYLMICLTGVQLHSLGNLFIGEELVLGGWSVPLTIFATIGVINAVNMSDGLDGLAGSVVFTVILSLLLISRLESTLILISLFSLAGFLVWNIRVGRTQAKVFMGDAGSTMLGLLLAYLLIKYSQSPSVMVPVMALWLLALPLIDAVAVLIIRPLNGRSPFQADRLHYHHQLIDRGLSVNKTVLTAITLQGLLIVFGWCLSIQNVSENAQLVVFLVLFSVYLVRLYYFSIKKVT